MFNYLKTAAEVISYCPRVSVPSGKELAFSNAASRLIDAFCGRGLSIQHYLLDFELSSSLRGRVPLRPIVAMDPVVLTTGFRVRPLGKSFNGGRQLLGEWQDITIPSDLESLVNTRTGRIEIFTDVVADFSREGVSGGSSAVGWLAKIEAKIGLFVDTTLAATAAVGASSVTVASTAGITSGSTYLNFGANAENYLVTNIVGTVLTISPVLSATTVPSTLAIGTAVTQKVPDDLKTATALIIEDRVTYQPNTIRSTETLDVLTDRLARSGASPIPPDAQRMLMLGGYRN